MRSPVFASLALAIGSMCILSASTATDDLPDPATGNESLSFYADLVKETELRRRVNILYPNPQSIFDGLQVGYVSVRQGNLTFQRRDVAAGSGELAYFSRVYDSRSPSGRDFGPGWRLSLAEKLTALDDGLIYTDASGARHVFRLASSQHRNKLEEPLLSGQPVQIDGDGTRVTFSSHIASGTYAAHPVAPQHAATTIEVFGSLAVLDDGKITRVFQRQTNRGGNSGPYLLSSISIGNNIVLALSYRNGLISEVSNAAGVVFSVDRNRSGRIASVQDFWGRSVSYDYDSVGRLARVRDIAGNTWSYQYTPSGLLERAIGPNGKDILRVRYGGSGRVIESHSGRDYFFTYSSNQTSITEGTGHTHVFGHNEAGITNRLDSTNGVWWHMEFDQSNRITDVYSSTGTYQYFYGRAGEINRVLETTTDASGVRELQRDAQGRITGVYSQDGQFTSVDYADGLTRISGPDSQLEFELSASGKIAQVQQDGILISADYDAEGNLVSFRRGPEAVELGRDEMGRVAHVKHANGEVNQYTYDALGNRTSVTFGMGGAAHYSHDPSGNIVEVVVTERNGEEKRQFVEIGDMNRVESILYEAAGTLGIEYDSMGRAISFDMGSEVISVEYEGPDRISRIVSQAGGDVWHPDQPGETDQNTRNAVDKRLDVILGDSTGISHPDYGILEFDEVSFSMFVTDPVEGEVPGLRDAKRLYEVAEPLFSSNQYEAMLGFEKPSNPVFQPLEYRSTNCCILIPEQMRALVPDGRPFSDGTPALPFCLPSTPEPQPYVTITTPTQKWKISNSVRVRMPSVILQATLRHVPKTQSVFFLWSVDLEFSNPRAPSHRDYTNRVGGFGTANYVDFGNYSAWVSTWSPLWGGLLAGATNMRAHVTAYAGLYSYSQSRRGYLIHGENPTKNQIFSLATKVEYKAVCWKESGHKQFGRTADRPYTGISTPIFGWPDGWGLMQRDPSPSERHMWDWNRNLSEGIQYLEARYTEAFNYLTTWYDETKDDPEKRWSWNPRENTDEVWNEAFARYNTGRPIYSRNGNGGDRNCDYSDRSILGCAYSNSVRGHIDSAPWNSY